ncbi:MAG TPA: tetratricopeptide repeat protein, partial [Vicinamibacterales bacterium]|nr:tetratricopeptide repeat protein [Vicinamibacterales bacterium]
MSVGTSGKTYTFGPFRLDTAECLLLHNGERVPLEPQVYRTLVVLVENHQHLSRKEWLVQQIWGDTNVEEGGLTRNISVLRRVLGDGYIETIPKHGYRFVAQAAEVSAGTESAEAYQLYIKGRYHWNQRSEVDLKKATEYFEQAIERDPTYARAHSGLADSYTTLGYLSHLAPRDVFPRANDAAMTAVRLDATLTEPHTSLAYVRFYHDWDWTAAEAEFRRALTLNPHYATAHQWYAVYLTAMGRFEEARAAIGRAQALDPTSLVINTDVGFVLYYSRQYDAAIQQLQMVVDMNPDFALAHFWLGRAYQQQRRYDDAIAELRRVEAALHGWSVVRAAIGHVQGVSGRTREALDMLDGLERLAKERYVTPYG